MNFAQSVLPYGKQENTAVSWQAIVILQIGSENMKCPQCGYPRTRFVERQPKNDKGKPDKTWRRKDFSAKCSHCGFKFDTKEYFDIEGIRIEVKKEEWKPIEMKSKSEE